MRYSLLLIDDDPIIHELVRRSLPDTWTIFPHFDLNIRFPTRFHAALVDVHLTSNSAERQGLDAMKVIRAKSPLTEIVAASGDLDRQLMESCLLAGAQKFLAKPFLPAEFLDLLAKIEAHWQLKDVHLQKMAPTQMVGSTPAMQKLRREISQLRREPGPVLIEGETGTGKELVALLLHQQESQPRPWVQINVASIPDTLFESELFGHVRGAFTGAEQTKMGLAQAAHGGDLFLDEIEALPLHNQAKLLRFLDSGEVRKVGSTETTKVNARVIVATNERLLDLVQQKKFREDLFFRLEAKKVHVPPLRHRLEDLEQLVRTFLEKTKFLTDDGLTEMKRHSWPGNIRELKRICQQLSLVTPLPLIRQQDVRPFLLQVPRTESSNHFSFEGGLSHQLERFEARLIESCLREVGQIDKALELLKISRSHLYKKIKDYQIEL